MSAPGGAVPRPPGVLRLARLLVRARLRHLWNQTRARPKGTGALLVVLGLGSSGAYVLLFSGALRVIGERTGVAGQTTALALMAGAITLASFGWKASAGEAVLAGSPENEFYLVRPLSLATLVTARALAAIVTDPFGVFFLLPVLLATAMTWRLSEATLLVAVPTSLAAQVTVAALAQIIQIAVVRWVRRRHRATAWMMLRLLSAGTLAVVWMAGTTVLRAPVTFTNRLRWLEPLVTSTPATALAAPLVALRTTGLAVAMVALVPLLAAAVATVALASWVARRAGLHGWEEAGAPWAEREPEARGGAVLTPVRREWRMLARDRARLAAFIALPAMLVGVQIFGAIGWSWQTATVDRVAVFVFSVTLYMAALGPLGHMQAERQAFWILRAVPVSMGRLMAAKARAWATILAAIAAVAFGALVLRVPAATAVDIARAGALVVLGAVAMTTLAVALGGMVANLSSDARPALGPGTVYLFLAVGGLFNLVLTAHGWRLAVGVAVYAAVVAACWRSAVANLVICLDAEALRRRGPRAADLAPWLVVGLFGPAALGLVMGWLGAPRGAVVFAQLGTVAIAVLAGGGTVGWRLYRHLRENTARTGPRHDVARPRTSA